MTPDARPHEPELPRHDKSTRSAWALRRHPPNTVITVTRHSTLFHDGVLGTICATGSCHGEMYDEQYAGPSTLKARNEFGIPPMTFYAEEPELGHRENFGDSADDMVLQNEQDALRVAYAHRHNFVLDSTAPHLAPHIVITPPEKNIQDYYTPWFNAPGPQWPGQLMVTTPPNAMDHTLARVPSVRPPRLGKHAPPKTVFCLSKFKIFVASTTHERVHMENMSNVLQKRHRKAAAFAASEVGRRFPAHDQYVCPSEKPFRWTDPAEPLLQQLNQYRGTIVIESPTPFTVPHIIINEPPPQDPWIPWSNATTNPQDQGFGQYLTVPHRLVYQVHVATDDDDIDADTHEFYTSMPLEEEEESDFSCQDDDMVSGSFSSSSSESEPETPDPDSLMDEFLLEEEYDEEDEEDHHVHLFDCCDDSPWSGIINRFSAKASAATFASVVACDESEEDELPPFDDWYQSIAARTLVTMTA